MVTEIEPWGPGGDKCLSKSLISFYSQCSLRQNVDRGQQLTWVRCLLWLWIVKERGASQNSKVIAAAISDMGVKAVSQWIFFVLDFLYFFLHASLWQRQHQQKDSGQGLVVSFSLDTLHNNKKKCKICVYLYMYALPLSQSPHYRWLWNFNKVLIVL